ncbi:nitrite reductase small subunit NirD [Vibrio sp. CDRSL-10 TSBA]
MENWITICQAEDLVPNVGVCALVGGEQVAIFSCQRSGQLYAVSNFDPIGQANVMSRGMMGSLGGEPYVASPLYKQHFHLLSGECLEDGQYRLKTYPVRQQDGVVQVLASLANAA